MPRKKGFDREKARKIQKILMHNHQGIWLREIARLAGMPVSTVFLYLKSHMAEDVSIEPLVVAGRQVGRMKIVKLKRFRLIR